MPEADPDLYKIECSECGGKFCWYVRNEGLCRYCRRNVDLEIKSKGCLICGFHTTELAHIIPRRSPLSETINPRNNIVALCPNHHTLFDSFRLNEEDSKKFHAALSEQQMGWLIVLLSGDFPNNEEEEADYCYECLAFDDDCEGCRTRTECEVCHEHECCQHCPCSAAVAQKD